MILDMIRPKSSRQTFRPPIVRKASSIDLMLMGIFLFLSKVTSQLTKTLAATALAAAADWIRSKADQETATMLNKNLGSQQASVNRQNMYGTSYPTNSNYNNSNYYGSEYGKSYPSRGQETFPGFGN